MLISLGLHALIRLVGEGRSALKRTQIRESEGRSAT